MNKYGVPIEGLHVAVENLIEEIDSVYSKKGKRLAEIPFHIQLNPELLGKTPPAEGEPS